MIKINRKEQSTPVSFNDLAVGRWYLLEDGDLGNYEGYLNGQPAFICFSERMEFPFIETFDDSSDAKFIPVKVKNLEIDVE